MVWSKSIPAIRGTLRQASLGFQVSAWLVGYFLAIVLAHLSVNRAYGFDLILVNGGILLAALLLLPVKTDRQRLLLLLPALAVDWLLKVWLTGESPNTVWWISLSLVFQAWLGASLIERFAPQARLADSRQGIFWILLLGALVPSALSSLAPLIDFWLSDHYPGLAPSVSIWFWWFVRRFGSLVLLTPLLLLLLSPDQTRLRDLERQKLLQKPAAATQSRSGSALEFVGWVLLSCLLAAIIFQVRNPSGRELATYSFLLTPLVVVVAVRQPLQRSLLLVFVVSLVSLWVDSISAGQGAEGRRSMMALLVFLQINGLVVWLLGAMTHEREQALRDARKMRDMYEMLSNINQMLVKSQLKPQPLFEAVCQAILAGSSQFYRVCVSFVKAEGNGLASLIDPVSGELPPVTTVCRQNDEKLPLTSEDGAWCCELVRQVLKHQNQVIFQDCTESPEFAPCQARPMLQGGMAAFPIFQHDQLVAVLSICGRESQLFDHDMVRLFEEMAGDLGFALEVEKSQQRLKLAREVFEHSQEAIIITDASATILEVNPAFSRITGYGREEVIGQNPRILQSGKQSQSFYHKLWHSLLQQGCWRGEYWNRRKNGELYPQRGTISAVFNPQGQIDHLISIMEDVSEQVGMEEQLQQLVNYDVLTGLPNRLLLADRFLRALALAHREHCGWALLFIDLDDFKHVNEALGHQTGDELLVQVSKRFALQMRETDTLSRFGGDEFIVLMQGNEHDAAQLAGRLLAQSREPYQLGGQTLQLGCSIGIAIMPGDGENLGLLISAADAAMYRAKAEGRGRFVFFAQDMQIKAQNRIALKSDLAKAIANDELCLFFQPKMRLVIPHAQLAGSQVGLNGLAKKTARQQAGDLRQYRNDSYRLVGFEALVRWRHPEKGLIPPGAFIAEAEASGQIADIDRWVLHQAIREVAHWYQQGNALPVAVNVSATLFARNDFVVDLSQALAAAELPAHWIELEITEYVAMLDMQYTLDTFRALKQLGVGLSIDDFGTGYSSLAYLRDFPIDTVKIDMGFVKQVHLDVKNQGIVRAIIALANTLGLNTIAEGVECLEELDFLRAQCCREYQGYLFSKPLPVEALEAWLTENGSQTCGDPTLQIDS